MACKITINDPAEDVSVNRSDLPVTLKLVPFPDGSGAGPSAAAMQIESVNYLPPSSATQKRLTIDAGNKSFVLNAADMVSGKGTLTVRLASSLTIPYLVVEDCGQPIGINAAVLRIGDPTAREASVTLEVLP